jgi:exodeoxyribonuclease VII large subunit
MQDEMVFSVSDFVAYLNQTLEMAYPSVTIEGEISNFRVSKNRWVYFDLKDEDSSVKFFGTVYTLPGPLEDGMMVRVSGTPRLHNLYGFSVTYQTIQAVGEGSLRKAAELLQAKLMAEGLFDVERKRPLPYPPQRIALITASGSAAYADFIKILNARWRGVTIDHYDVLVQGAQSPAQIVSAIARANAQAELPDVIIVTRGGGSAEDLASFSTEQVTRAVAGSRVPTLVAIGHEIDLSLAELAADARASTPSNAAELLTPDRGEVLRAIAQTRAELGIRLLRQVSDRQAALKRTVEELHQQLQTVYDQALERVHVAKRILEAYDPTAAMRRGYALVRQNGTLITKVASLRQGSEVVLVLQDGTAEASISSIEQKEK